MHGRRRAATKATRVNAAAKESPRDSARGDQVTNLAGNRCWIVSEEPSSLVDRSYVTQRSPGWYLGQPRPAPRISVNSRQGDHVEAGRKAVVDAFPNAVGRFRQQA